MEHKTETLSKCPSCTNTSLSNQFECIDHTYSKDRFTITKCTHCGLLFTNPRPTESTIGTYYDNPEYVSHTDTQDGFLFKIYRSVKRFSLKQKRVLLSKLTEGRTVLDYGAGSGDFSNELSSNGWNVHAYEPDEKARTLIIQKNTTIKIVSELNEIENNTIDVITLWHVLEHVHQLNETLKHFQRILKPSGKLIIAVPNHTSFDAEFYREEWAAYDVPRHLYHFNPETIIPLLSKLGFKFASLKPLWFDSVYVSLLSERNTNNSGLIGWLRATLVGLISNIITILDRKKCSSLTYIFGKPI